MILLVSETGYNSPSAAEPADVASIEESVDGDAEVSPAVLVGHVEKDSERFREGHRVQVVARVVCDRHVVQLQLLLLTCDGIFYYTIQFF